MCRAMSFANAKLLKRHRISKINDLLHYFPQVFMRRADTSTKQRERAMPPKSNLKIASPVTEPTGAIKCLSCDGTLLNVYEGNFLSNFSYDVCEKCGGIWVDKGGLDKIAFQTPGSVEYCTVSALEIVKQQWWDAHPEAKDDHPHRNCIRCPETTMQKVAFMTDSDIILDYCGDCGGMWLDKGELKRIDAYIKSFNKYAVESEFVKFLNHAHGSSWHKIVTHPDYGTGTSIADKLPNHQDRQKPKKVKATNHPCAECGVMMNEVTFHGATVDQCPSCHSFWFAKTKFKQTVEKFDDDLRILDLELWKVPEKFKFKAIVRWNMVTQPTGSDQFPVFRESRHGENSRCLHRPDFPLTASWK